jgi:translocator protein
VWPDGQPRPACMPAEPARRAGQRGVATCSVGKAVGVNDHGTPLDVRAPAPSERAGIAVLPLAGFIALSLAAGFLGGLAADTGSWYQELDKPPLNPPSWLFGPVWTALYVLIGVAAYLAWRAPAPGRGAALAAWGAQLVLNLVWSLVFFGAHRPGWALVDIVALLVAIVVTMVLFARRSRAGALLLLPYLLWVAFASYLNAGIVVLN